jgi:hypothetical protein
VTYDLKAMKKAISAIYELGYEGPVEIRAVQQIAVSTMTCYEDPDTIEMLPMYEVTIGESDYSLNVQGPNLDACIAAALAGLEKEGNYEPMVTR